MDEAGEVDTELSNLLRCDSKFLSTSSLGILPSPNQSKTLTINWVNLIKNVAHNSSQY